MARKKEFLVLNTIVDCPKIECIFLNNFLSVLSDDAFLDVREDGWLHVEAGPLHPPTSQQQSSTLQQQQQLLMYSITVSSYL